MKRFNKALLRGTAILVLLLGLSSLFVGCGGDTGGDGDSFDGSSFDDNDANAGGIRLEVNEDRLSVSDVSGFHVYVTDAQGAPVPNIEIACDTELGLALVEPTTGFELTDSNGQMSGRVGCANPGSYQIGCRLPVFANKRAFKTVICEGDPPEGFNGFPGSGGGTLGVGAGGGTGGRTPVDVPGSLAVSGVVINENGSDTLSVDVERGACGFVDQNGDGDTTDAGDIDPEPFTDTRAKFTIKNETGETVNFSSFSYTVSGASGSGTFFESTELALSIGGSVPTGSSTEVTGLFLKASSPSKRFTGSSAAISSSLGFRNVTFTIFGTTGSGQSVQAQATIGVSFGNFNKCDASS